MWFADLGLVLTLLFFVGVLGAGMLAWAARRAGRSSRWVRHTLWVGGIIAAALLVGQAVVVDVVEDANGFPAVDDPVRRWFLAHRTDWATALARLLAVVGGGWVLTVVVTVTVLVLLWRGWRWQATVTTLAGLGGALLVVGFKPLYARERPPLEQQIIVYESHALPSGHALGSTVVFGLVAGLVVLTGHALPAKILAVAGAALTVVLVGVSRIYLAAHWLTDVLAGWLLGGAWLTLAVTALALLRRRDGVGSRPAPRPEVASGAIIRR